MKAKPGLGKSTIPIAAVTPSPRGRADLANIRALALASCRVMGVKTPITLPPRQRVVGADGAVYNVRLAMVDDTALASELAADRAAWDKLHHRGRCPTLAAELWAVALAADAAYWTRRPTTRHNPPRTELGQDPFKPGRWR